MPKTYTHFKAQRRRELQQKAHRQHPKGIAYFERRTHLTVAELIAQGELFTGEKLKPVKRRKPPHSV
jgi:hypothetical protein